MSEKLKDKSSYGDNSNKPQDISEALQNYINQMAEEIILKGEDFAKNRKWLRKYLEAEDINYESYETDFLDLLQLIDDYRQTQSSAILRMMNSLACNCYISGELLQTLISRKILCELLQMLIIRKTNEEKEEIELTLVAYNDKYGFIDKTRKKIIPCKYDVAHDFSEGLAHVALNGKCSFIDKTGKEIIPLKYDEADYFHEGFARVRLNAKWGFIDKTGKEVIPLKYDFACFFSEGLAEVKLNGKWGFIDKTGEEVIPLKYNNTQSFSEELALVSLNNKRFYINKKGEYVKDYEV